MPVICVMNKILSAMWITGSLFFRSNRQVCSLLRPGYVKLTLLSEQDSFFKSHIAQTRAVHVEAWRHAAAVHPVDITCVGTHRAGHNTFCKGPALPGMALAKVPQLPIC